MTKRSIASLVLKLMAVSLVLMFVMYLPGLSSLSQTIERLVEGPRNRETILDALLFVAAALIPLLWLGIAFVVLWKSDWIAKRLVDIEEEKQGTSRISNEQVQRLAFVCMGIWFVVKGLSRFAPLLVHLDFIRNYPEAERSWHVLQQMLPPSIWLAVGLTLIARPRQVSRLIERLQGKEEKES